MSSLWYKEPAKVWEEALPLGNGRIGAMIFGGVEQERIQVNEESIWYGGPVDRNNPDAKAHLEEIRQHIFDARTRQELTGQIALTESEKQPAHGARTRWALRVGKKRINFYQNSGISNAECDKITCEYPFAIRGVFALPFSLVRERVQPYRTADAPVSADAARAALEQALLQQLRETIGADGTILAYETAAEVTGGVLTVTLTAECEQEIGRAQATPDAEFLQLRPPAGEGTTADD